ncbi:hypothetical protein F0562_021133 [Nyssa sinensis]|uniref:CRAL-TRIO domain-containing protein n=1 Tax=Nyssa sinensis TaxID=561372 RepID=A0A5J5BNU5_9ASTE|nr:hypothetical protein F0562_021133 [Nyssa sinensis]
MPEEKVFPAEVNEDEYCTSNDQETDQENLETMPEEADNLASINLTPACSENEGINMKLSRKKALLEFRCRVEDAILSNYILGKNNGKSSRESDGAKEKLEDITLWGVPLLPSKCHEGTDVVLMKFLKAKDFKVSEAFTMLRKTLKWRREFNVDGIREENFASHLENVSYIDGTDKDGHPLYYNLYGAFKDRELYKKTFGTEEKREEFLRWRVQTMEKCIQKLSFKPNVAHSVIQITDMKNMPGSAMKELRLSSKKTLMLFQENYPELFFRNIIVNVPFWNFLLHVLQSRFITQRTKSKFIFARPSKLTETLLKYVAPENIPVQYGGLKRGDEDEFSSDDKVSELNVRGGAIVIQIPVTEVGVTVVWDITVVGYEVTYREEFVPDDDCSYNVLLQKEKKMGETVRNSFYISEPGKIDISIENETYKKKRVFYSSSGKTMCQIQRLNALEPTGRSQAEAGVTEFWDENNEQLECAGVAVVRHTIQPRGLLLPSYTNAPVLAYIVQGVFKGPCFLVAPETFQSSQQSQEAERGQRFQERHQKIRHLREGDIFAMPAGTARWTYNNGDRDLVAVVFLDTSNNANQLDLKSRRFFLAGNPQDGQEQQGRRSGQQERFGSVLRGFDVQILAEALGVDTETARKLQGEDDQRGHIVRVERGLQVVRPPLSREEEEEQEREGRRGNGLEETICSMRLRENINDPSRADVYNPRAGRLSSLNSLNLPILNLLQLSAEKGVLYRNATMAPHWNLNAHSVVYATRGEARCQIVDNRGQAVFDAVLREGQLMVVPQNFAVVKQAGEQGFEWVALKTNENALINTLAGRTSALRGIAGGRHRQLVPNFPRRGEKVEV